MMRKLATHVKQFILDIRNVKKSDKKISSCCWIKRRCGYSSKFKFQQRFIASNSFWLFIRRFWLDNKQSSLIINRYGKTRIVQVWTENFSLCWGTTRRSRTWGLYNARRVYITELTYFTNFALSSFLSLSIYAHDPFTRIFTARLELIR